MPPSPHQFDRVAPKNRNRRVQWKLYSNIQSVEHIKEIHVVN